MTDILPPEVVDAIETWGPHLTMEQEDDLRALIVSHRAQAVLITELEDRFDEFEQYVKERPWAGEHHWIE